MVYRYTDDYGFTDKPQKAASLKKLQAAKSCKPQASSLKKLQASRSWKLHSQKKLLA